MKWIKIILIGLLAAAAPVLFSLQAVKLAQSREMLRDSSDTIRQLRTSIEHLKKNAGERTVFVSVTHEHKKSQINPEEQGIIDSIDMSRVRLNRIKDTVDHISAKDANNSNHSNFLLFQQIRLNNLESSLLGYFDDAMKKAYPRRYQEIGVILAEIDKLRLKIKSLQAPTYPQLPH